MAAFLLCALLADANAETTVLNRPVQERFFGEVVEVTDSRTLRIDTGRKVVEVSLAGMAAPTGPNVAETQRRLARLATGRLVEVFVLQSPADGPALADVRLNTRSLSASLIRMHLANPVLPVRDVAVQSRPAASGAEIWSDARAEIAIYR